MQRRLFAVVPAAGMSRRMGQPKLLLPLGDSTVIDRLLSTLKIPQISDTIVVVRPDDDNLAAQIAPHRATVVQPAVPPPDMRDSVQIAIDEIRRQYAPHDDDGWILIPADHPILDRECLSEIIDAWNKSDSDILIPRYQQRRGHPTILRWKIAGETHTIPPDKGLNWLVRRYEESTEFFESRHEAVVVDLDTPQDYDRLCQSEADSPTN